MYTGKQSITINGESKIGDKVVVSMIASISTSNNQMPTTSNTVLNNELYAANIEECQAGIITFNKAVLDKQKEILGGVQNEKEII